MNTFVATTISRMRALADLCAGQVRASLFGLLALCLCLPAFASRVKDITLIEGGRDNQLVGYGLIVGLAGDGDSNSQTTLRSVANVLARYGIAVDPTQMKAKNSAAVMVTADISAFLKPGGRIDCVVASLGDAKTLQGGVLIQTPLLGADGRVYAVAQGPIAIGGFLGGGGGPGGASVQKNHPTVGIISNGAIIEREIPSQFVSQGALALQLHNPDFTTVSRLASAINTVWPGICTPRDAATIDVKVPAAFQGHEIAFIASMGQLEVNPDTEARIIINERTGTIVATSSVRLSQVAISHGSLTISISSNVGVSQPNAFSGGQTMAVPSTQTAVNEVKGGFTIVAETASVERLAAALNALGVSTRDMMAIFQSLKRAGALQAELIIN